jgi:hypothetical protein
VASQITSTADEETTTKSNDSFISCEVIDKSTFEETIKSGNANYYADYLFIPTTGNLASRADDELCALMRLVQVRLLIGEIVGRLTSETTNLIVHDLAHFGHLVAGKLTYEPSPEALSGLSELPEEVRKSAHILPFPQILKAVGFRIAFWSGQHECFNFNYYNWSEWLNPLWDLALDNLRIFATDKTNLGDSEEITHVSQLLPEIREKLINKLILSNTDVNPNDVITTIKFKSQQGTPHGALLSMLFLQCMTEFLWHGELNKALLFKISFNPSSRDNKYVISFQNNKRVENTTADGASLAERLKTSNDPWETFIRTFQDSKKDSNGVWGTSGSAIVSRLRRELGVNIDVNDKANGGDSYITNIRVPKE